MKYVIILSLLLFSSPSLAEDVAQAETRQPEAEVDNSGGFTVRDLVDRCVQCSKPDENLDCNFCNGVMTGAATMYGILEGYKTFCPPDSGLDTHKARNAFRTWARRNQNLYDENAVYGVLEALKAAFPCKL